MNQQIGKQKNYDLYDDQGIYNKFHVNEEKYKTQINLQLPKIEKPGKQSLPSITFNKKEKVNQFRIANQMKFKQLLSKNRSLLQNSLAKIRNQRELKNPTAIARNNVHKNQTFANVMPRIYKHFEQNAGQTQFPRLRPTSCIPELQQSKVLDNYRVISHVGKGCFSVVSAAVNKNNNTKCAIKTYNRIDQMDDVRIKNIQSQVQNLFHLHHQNIIELKHAVKDGRKIQLIMQNGGKQSLSGLLRKTTAFEQHTAKNYFRQIASAMAYCHSQNICHRDLKLQNILVDDDGKVKIIDFGFSLKCSNKIRLTSYCGTPPYMSPEIAARCPYSGQTSDVWALGVALYLMLTGKFPFKAGNQKELYRLIQQGKYKPPETMSVQAKSLIASMLKVDENSRITAQQIMNSDWLKSVS